MTGETERPGPAPSFVLCPPACAEAVRAALPPGCDLVVAGSPEEARAAFAARAGALGAEGGGAGEMTLDGRTFDLTTLERAVFDVLSRTPGRTVSRAELLRQIHGTAAGSVLPRVVDSTVSRLRRKLGPSGWRVQTVWGRGYRWNAGERPSASPFLTALRWSAGTLGVLVVAALFLARPPAGERRAGVPDRAPEANAKAARAATAAPVEVAAEAPVEMVAGDPGDLWVAGYRGNLDGDEEALGDVWEGECEDLGDEGVLSRYVRFADVELADVEPAALVECAYGDDWFDGSLAQVQGGDASMARSLLCGRFEGTSPPSAPAMPAAPARRAEGAVAAAPAAVAAAPAPAEAVGGSGLPLDSLAPLPPKDGFEVHELTEEDKTLSNLARTLGVPLAELLAANPQIADPDRVRAGQPVYVPAARARSDRAAEPPADR